MPELPEVQTTVNGFNKYMKGQTITDVWTNYNSPSHIGKDTIKNPVFFKQFKKKVTGAKVVSAERRAKNILIHLDNDTTILIHMKMTGHVLYGTYAYDSKKDAWSALDKGPLQDPFNRFIHLVFTISNKKHIVLSDMRKFAKVTLISNEELAKSADFKKLGPEPLDPRFSATILATQLKRKPTGKIKTVLMDQHILSGIGNIYSDEILWYAHVHPEKRIRDLTQKEFTKLYEGTISILTKSLSLGGDSMSDYRNIEGEKGGFHPHHNAYRQHGKKCTEIVWRHDSSHENRRPQRAFLQRTSENYITFTFTDRLVY